MSQSAFSERTRELVRQRANNRCDLCGSRILAGVAQLHHRSPRKAGGSSNADLGSPANALLLHVLCHARVEKDRSRSYSMGWLVHAWDNPAEIPVRLFNGWFMLTVEGECVPTSPVPSPRR